MIAVVGLAVELPGARDVDAYWDLLVEGRSGLSRLTDAQLDQAGVPAAVRAHPGFVPVSGLVPWAEDFDAAAFGYAVGDAGMLDPQQRRFLTCARHALEDAGHAGGRDAGTVGVFAGAAHSTYLASVLGDVWDPSGSGVDPIGSLQAAFGCHGDYLPMHVAHRLDLTGPAVTVQSACATSLVAIHEAVQALLDEECDTAIAGGVSLTVPQGRGYVHVPGGLYAADGVVRPFGAQATGMVYSQGVGAVVLRRLEDAQADGDRILAVVHGSAVGNDGARRTTFTAPTAAGQQRTAAEALAVAGVDPRQIGLVEAHGTGTLLGDAIEVQGLRRAFGATGAVKPWCALGSVKGNLGHTNTAAGVAAFVKAVLAIHHRVQPATLHADPVNPELQLESSPFTVVHETREWVGPELASVNSYGVGGSNVHLVLGPPPAPVARPRPEQTTPQVVLLSAPSDRALTATAGRLADRLDESGAPHLADVALTLARGRFLEPRRAAVVAGSAAEAAGQLRATAPVAALTGAPVVLVAPSRPAETAHALDRLRLLAPAAVLHDEVRDQLGRLTDDDASTVALLVVAARLLGALGLTVDDVEATGSPLAEAVARAVLAGQTVADAVVLGGSAPAAPTVPADGSPRLVLTCTTGPGDAELLPEQAISPTAVQVALLTAVAELWAAGADVDLDALLGATGATVASGAARVGLPATVLDEQPIPRPQSGLSASTPDAAATPQPGATARPVAEVLPEVWCELLGVDSPDPDGDFWDLGGHSLLALRLVSVVEQRSGVRLSAVDLLEAPTLGALTARAETARTDQAGSSPAPAPVEAATPVRHTPALPDDELPMTRVQHAYWVGRSGGYRHGDVPCYFAYELESADLDLDRYQAAWRAVVARHPMLRSVVTEDGTLRVVDTPAVRLKVTDLRESPDDERRFRLERIRTDVFRRPGPADRWPLFTVQAVLLPDGTTRVFVGVDVLVCDAASWFLMVRELGRAYRGETLEVMPVAQVRQVLDRLEERRSGPAFEQAAAYWRDRYDEIPPAPPVASPTAGEAEDHAARFMRFAHELDPAQWTRFQEHCRARRVTPSSALLAAYAQTLRDWTGQDRLTVMLTTFDRPDTDVADVVGDFTTLALHVAEARGSHADQAVQTQRRLFADLQHGVFTALDVSGELASRRGEVQEWPVVFTSALGVQADDHDPDWMGRQVRALTQTPQVLFDHQVLEHAGGLRLQFDVLVPVVDPDQAEQVARRHHDRLVELADRPEAWDEIVTGSTGSSAPTEELPVVDETPTESVPTSTYGADELTLPLREATTPDARVLHLLHPSGGDITCYADLANLLPDDVTVLAYSDLYGRIRRAPGRPLDADLTAMAEGYLHAIQRQQPHGPYLLGGWSMGGDLAQEIAVQLEERGERVALLVMLDSNVPSVITPLPGRTPEEVRIAAAVRYLGALEGFRGDDLGLGAGADLDELLRGLSTEERALVLEERLRELGVLSRREPIDPRIDAVVRDLAALARHEPRALVGKDTLVLLARAEQRAPRNSGIGVGVDDLPEGSTDLGWGPLLPPHPPTAPLDAHHYTVLQGPSLPQVAQLFRFGLSAAAPSPEDRTSLEVTR